MFGTDALLGIMTIIACLAGFLGYSKGLEAGRREAWRMRATDARTRARIRKRRRV